MDIRNFFLRGKKYNEQLKLLETIISLMPGHVYWTNTENIYLGCNDNQAKSAGLSSPKEIIGKRNKDLPWNKNAGILPEELDKINSDVMKSGKTITVEEPGTLPDGTELIFLSNKSPIHDANGKVIGMVGISIDITQQKKTERELQETKEKLDGMTLVGAAIAHELRTPLSMFGIATDNVKAVFPALKKTYLAAKEKNMAEENISTKFLENIDSSLASMTDEVDSAFTFIDIALMNTRQAIDNGHPEIINISDTIDYALTRYPFVGSQRQFIEWQHDDKNNFTLYADKLLITHVLFNLIKNSLYYIAKANKGNIQITLKKGATHNQLLFKDTGTGISSEILPYIFDSFFTRTDPSAHPAGIGLTFCKNVMTSLKGGIVCESIEGEYTLFTLSFLSFPDKI